MTDREHVGVQVSGHAPHHSHPQPSTGTQTLWSHNDRYVLFNQEHIEQLISDHTWNRQDIRQIVTNEIRSQLGRPDEFMTEPDVTSLIESAVSNFHEDYLTFDSEQEFRDMQRSVRVRNRAIPNAIISGMAAVILGIYTGSLMVSGLFGLTAIYFFTLYRKYLEG